MKSVKLEVQSMLMELPNDCTLEDLRYHLYVMEKVRRGIQRAGSEGTIPEEEVEKRLSRWTLE